MKWRLAFALLSALPAVAGPIDIAGLDHATLAHDASLLVEFSVWNYAVNNPGAPPPTHVGLTVLGLSPDTAPSTLPDSTSEYYPGYLFEARLESDGSAGAAFDDLLLLVPGLFSAGGAPLDVGVLSGSIDLTAETAEQVFGETLGARFVLHNLGDSFVLGLGNGYTIRQSIWEPDVQGLGPRTVAGLTGGVAIGAPEPSGWMLLLGGTALMAVTRLGLRRVRASKRVHSRL